MITVAMMVIIIEADMIHDGRLQLLGMILSTCTN
jgi:hypothetical protein